MIFYSHKNTKNDKLERAFVKVRETIERESEAYEAFPSIKKSLFNTVSYRDAEDFSRSLITLGHSFGLCVDFAAEFAITEDMIAPNGTLSPDAERRVRNFVRKYHKKMDLLCEFALINGKRTSAVFEGVTLKLSTYDEKALFESERPLMHVSGVQSNYLGGKCFGDEEELRRGIGQLSRKIFDMKDENGDALEYKADTLILPSNRPELEEKVKRIAPEYQMSVITLPNWQTDKDSVMVMSSESSANLLGNVLVENEPLMVTDWYDKHTGNYIWQGRCRFGVGFCSYKHILLAEEQ